MLLAYSGCLFLDFLGSLVSIYLHMWVIKIDIDDKYKMFHKCIQSVYYTYHIKIEQFTQICSNQTLHHRIDSALQVEVYIDNNYDLSCPNTLGKTHTGNLYMQS